MEVHYDTVRVFSATKFKDRESLGGRVTNFLRSFAGEILDTVVTQSSDREFHCLTITVFARAGVKRRRTNGRKRHQDGATSAADDGGGTEPQGHS